jgi:hypothetical protein
MAAKMNANEMILWGCPKTECVITPILRNCLQLRIQLEKEPSSDPYAAFKRKHEAGRSRQRLSGTWLGIVIGCPAPF